MLSNKSAGVGFPFTYITTLVLLFLVISFFMVYFFILGGAKAESVVINTDNSMSSLKLSLIMNTPLSELKIAKYENSQETVYTLLIEAYLSNVPEKNQEFVNAMTPILSSMRLPPMPIKGKPPKLGSSVGWNFRVFAIDGTPIEGLAVTNAPLNQKLGEESEDVKYLKESLVIPVPDDPPIILELYFACLACDESYLRSYA